MTTKRQACEEHRERGQAVEGRDEGERVWQFGDASRSDIDKAAKIACAQGER